MSFRTDVQTRLQEDSTRLTDTEVDELVTAALRELSHDHPRKVTRELTGDGTNTYPLVTNASPDVTKALDGWEHGLSQVLEVQAASGDVWYRVDTDAWYEEDQLYTSVWLPTLWFTAAVTSGEARRVRFTMSWTENDSDLVGRVYEAVVTLASAKCYATIAAEYAAMTDSTHVADTVNKQDVVRSYLDLRDVANSEYRKLVGLMAQDSSGGSSVPAASITKDLVDYYPSQGRGASTLRRGYN